MAKVDMTLFEETLAALKRCQNALDFMGSEPPSEVLTPEEFKCACELVDLCGTINHEYARGMK